MLWKAEYLRQWPVTAQSAVSEKTLIGKDVLLEKNKRIAASGELPVTLCFRLKHKIAEYRI